jgi:tRNA pseudouridine38-40 synthase
VLALSCRSVDDQVPPASVMTRVVLVVEYDGTDYFGFQWQDGQATIQQELERAVLRLTGENTRVVSASRTDTGVHADNQVVIFRTSSELPLHNFISGLNHFLPEAIAVKTAYYAPDGFHVQRSALRREYQYRILNRATRSPLKQRVTWCVPGQLEIEKMQEACRYLVGEHDFASFTSPDSPMLKNTVRHVYRADVQESGEEIIFTVVAGSFLTHQVRNMVGMLVEVGRGKMSPLEFYSIMERKQIGLAGPRAPACGLRLVNIVYPHPIEEELNENI